MTLPRLASISRVLAAVCALLSLPAFAAEGEAPSPTFRTERGTLSLRWGASLRQTTQVSELGRLGFSGRTENAPGIAGSLYLGRYFGFTGAVDREAFRVVVGGEQQAAGALLGAVIGPSLRLEPGPFRLELQAGYAFSQLPYFEDPAQPSSLRPAARHAGIAAAKMAWRFAQDAALSLRASAPFFSTATVAGTDRGSSKGFEAGAGLSYPVLRTDAVVYSVELDVAHLRDEFTTAAGRTLSQQRTRFGLGVSLSFRGALPPPDPVYGELKLVVVDADSQKPLQGAQVALTLSPTVPPATTAADGTTAFEELPPGELTTRATLDGYLPAETQAVVKPNETVELKVLLRKVPPAVGSVLVKVVNRATGAPIADAAVTAGERQLFTTAGSVVIDKVSPGLLSIRVTSPGFKPGEETASVVAGTQAEVTVALDLAKSRALATVTGFVRSPRGQPISASLTLAEAEISTRADNTGAFVVRVLGGSYSVVVSAPGFVTQTRKVTVKDGDQVIFNMTLRPVR